MRLKNGLNSKDVMHMKWKSTEGQAGYNGISRAADSGMSECENIIRFNPQSPPSVMNTRVFVWVCVCNVTHYRVSIMSSCRASKR